MRFVRSTFENTALNASKERLEQKIEASQEETIDVLSKVIHKGFNMHEERIRAIEEQLDLPHKN